jgi:hypothetical protein
MLTVIDRRILDYCARRRIDPARAATRWIWRRHPELAKLHVARALVAAGRAHEIPAELLEGELAPLSTAERYRRAGQRSREWRAAFGTRVSHQTHGGKSAT